MPFAHPIHRTLILVAQPEYLATDDLLIIREKMARQAPDIHVLVAGRADRAELINASYWQRPALTVSFGPLGRFRPLRGKVFANQAIPKLEQYRRLAAAGVATPRTAPFRFGMDLSAADWGELCVLKPDDIDSTSSGRGLYLFRARRLAALMPDDLPPSHFARGKPMIVQSFIDTGARFSVYRCLTLFGEVIYQNLATAPEPHPPLASDDQVIEGILPEPPRTWTTPVINTDADVMAFASSVHAVFPDMPLLGCDIVREHATGRLYAIEVNAGGNVWHLSSPRTSSWRSITKIQDYLSTFKSYDKAALALIRTVRRHAS
jgi:hypothetical protein